MNINKSPLFGLKHEPGIALDYEKLKRAEQILKSVDHRFRNRIIDLIQEQGSMEFVDIMIALRVEQSYLRAHLNNLRRAKILTIDTKVSAKNRYDLNYDQYEKLAKVIETLANGYKDIH